MKAADLESEDSAPDHPARQPHRRGRLHLAARPTSTSSRWRRIFSSATASTGSARRSCAFQSRSQPRSSRGSRSCATWTSAERRLPQDGRIVFKKFTKKNIDIDLRVATGPMNFGEKVVMRILDKQKCTLPLPALGFSEENLAKYRECIRQPYGMILHCGPTGSGKSMTLYSALGEINTPDVNIQTAEDPIEYTLAGHQPDADEPADRPDVRAGASLLPAHGPGRDPRRRNPRRGDGRIAIEAALTGHLARLHAPHQRRALDRSPVSPKWASSRFNISASLVCVCAQRLLRRVCKNCKQPYEARRAARRRSSRKPSAGAARYSRPTRMAATCAAETATRAASASMN